MSRKSLLVDITSVLSSNVFAVLLALAISVILYRQLGPEGYGLYSAILVIPLLVVSFSQLGIRASSIYHIGHKSFPVDKTVSMIIMLLFATSVAGALITVATFLFMDENYSVSMIAVVVTMIPFRLASLYFGGVFLGREQIKRANIIRWMPMLINLVLIVVLVWMIRMDIVGALLSMLIPSIIISAWAYLILRKEYTIKLGIDKKILTSLFKMGILFALSFLVIQLNYRIDILILERMSTLEQVGYYSLGVAIAEKLWQLPLAIGVVLMSRTANATDQEVISISTAKLLRVSLIASLLASAVIFLVAPFVVPWIWGEESVPSVVLLQYILPGVLFISVYRVISSRLSGLGLPLVSIYVFLPSLLINVVLNLWLIPLYDAMGAVIATNVSYILGSIAFIIVYSKIVKMPVGELFRFQKSDFNFLRNLPNRFLNKQ